MTKFRTQWFTSTSVGAITGLAVLVIAGGAQAAAADDRDEGPVRSVSEVVVTAQKRPENVQDIPTAITAITAEVLEMKQVETAGDLEQVSLGLVSVPTGAASAQLVIRGIGAVNTFAGGDPGVPIHLDGHYLQSPSFILHDMLDVSRVEVLRGPQGTLYGRNAIGGNVNIISNSPTKSFEGHLTLGIGNYTDRVAELVLSGPISSRIQGRIALSAGGHNGYVENISPIRLVNDVVDDEYINTRGALRFEIMPNLSATVSAFYYKNDAEPFVYRLLGNPATVVHPTFTGFVPANYVNPTNADPLKVRIDSPNIGYDIAKGAFLDVSWDLDKIQLKSLTAISRTENYYQIDLDGTDVAPKVEYGTKSSYETVSQEFQAIYSGTAFHVVGGLYYYQEDSRFFRYFMAPPAVYGVGYAYYYNPEPNLKEDSYGTYINGDYDLTDRIKVTAGLRYSSDDKSMLRGYEVRIDGVSLGNTIDNQQKKWSKPTGRLAITYRLTDSVNVFASIATGYKAGGFNALGTTQPPYNPETAINYELGVKAELLDRRLRVNVDLFQSDYSDKQELVVSAGAGALNEVSIKNSGGATLRGAEIEAEAAVGDYVTLDAGVAYLDATYESLTSSDPLRPLLGNINLKGNTIPYAPKWKVSLGATVKLPLSDDLGVSTVGLAYSWTDELYASFYNRRGATAATFPNDYVAPRDSLNVSANWVAPNGKWRIFGYVRNVLDSIDVVSTGPSYHGLQYVNYTNPRTFGMRVTREF